MIYFKVLVLNLIIVLLLPVILLQALWVRKKTAVLPEPDGQRVLTSADSKLLLTNNVLVIGDSAAAGVGATTQMGALTGLLYLNLVKHYEKADWSQANDISKALNIADQVPDAYHEALSWVNEQMSLMVNT